MGTVYGISFIGSRRLYVGSTVNDPRRRLSAHIHRLNRDNHHSVFLQRSANKYGLENLCFSILEVAEPDVLLLAEQKWIEKAWGRHLNASPTAQSRLGMRMPERAKTAISQSLIGNQRRKGIAHSDDVKSRIGRSLSAAYSSGSRSAVFDAERLKENNKVKADGGRRRAEVWLRMAKSGLSYEEIESATGFEKSTIRKSLKRYFNFSKRKET